jgi:hypothetical protein
MENIYDLPVEERKAAFLKLLDEIPEEDKSDEMVERRLKILREFRSGYIEET